MQLQNNIMARKTVALLFSILIGVGIILLALHFLSTGKLFAKTSTENTKIMVFDANGKTIAGPLNPLNKRLHAGNYTVTASGPAFSISKSVNISARKNTTIILTPPKTQTLQPVIKRDIATLYATDSSLTYLDKNSGFLYQVDAQNTLKQLSSGQTYIDGKLISPNIGLFRTQSNQLYVYQNGVFSQLNIPFKTEGKSLTYTMTSTGAVYININKTVYNIPSSGVTKKIYYTGTDNNQMYVSGNKLALVYTGTKEDEGTEGGSTKPYVKIIDLSKNTVTANVATRAYSGEWNNKGDKLLTRGDAGVQVYNSKLQRISSFPSENVGSAIWSGDNKVLYSSGKDLLSFRIDNKESLKLSRATSGDISTLYASEDNNTVYLANNTESDSAELSRLKLSGVQEFPQTGSLGVFLPETINGCTLDYVVFKKAGITATNNTKITSEQCIDTAKTELSYYGLDPLKFTLSSVSDSSLDD